MTSSSELRQGIDTSTSWGKLEYTDWRDENLSWKKTCYIGDWSWLDEFRIQGPDALRFLSDHAVNSFAKFDIGQAKHIIVCNKAGKVIGEGVLTRWAQQQFEFNARGPVVNWLEYRLATGDYNAVSTTTISEFKFQVSGPTALAVCEKVVGGSLRDINFMRFRTARINGREVTLLRQGMAGGPSGNNMRQRPRPSRVRVTLRVVRSNRAKPRAPSSSLMVLIAARESG